MINIENKIRVHIDVLKSIIHTKNGLSDLENFLNGYISLYNKSGNFYLSEYMNKAIKKGKVNKKIEPFYSENKDFIKMIYENNYYYHITSLFYDKENIHFLLDELRNTEIKTLKNFIKSMEELELNEFIYTNSDLNIQSCILINKSPFSKLVEFNTIITDGDFFLLGKYHNSMYPYYLKDAKYIYNIHNKNKVLNSLIVNTLDVSLPTYDKYKNSIENIPNFDSEELYERSYFIRSLFELKKSYFNMNLYINTINSAKKKVKNKNDSLDSILDMMNRQISEMNTKIDELEKTAFKYGFNDELLEINIDYMRNCQSTMDNDLV